MNVLFHTTTAIGVALLLTDTTAIEKSKSFRKVMLTGFAAFAIGIITHGVLDYIPHCYPIHSRVDAIAALTIMIAFTVLTRKRYRFITAMAFIGSVFPDLVDLSPGILNTLMRTHLPVFDKIFPWHWHEHSGSIYHGECGISTINHILVVLTVLLICWFRRKTLKRQFATGPTHQNNLP